MFFFSEKFSSVRFVVQVWHIASASSVFRCMVVSELNSLCLSNQLDKMLSHYDRYMSVKGVCSLPAVGYRYMLVMVLH